MIFLFCNLLLSPKDAALYLTSLTNNSNTTAISSMEYYYPAPQPARNTF